MPVLSVSKVLGGRDEIGGRSCGPDARRPKQIRPDVQTRPRAQAPNHATASTRRADAARLATGRRQRRRRPLLARPTGHLPLLEHPHQARDPDTAGVVADVVAGLVAVADRGRARAGRELEPGATGAPGARQQRAFVDGARRQDVGRVVGDDVAAVAQSQGVSVRRDGRRFGGAAGVAQFEQNTAADQGFRAGDRRSRMAEQPLWVVAKSDVQSVRGRFVRAHVQSFRSEFVLAGRLGAEFDILQRSQGG